MKQILLLSVEVQHQREIVGKYDSELRKLQAGVDDIHALYKVQLDSLKQNMIEMFEAEMQS